MNKKAILLNDTSKESHYGCGLVIHNIKTLCIENGVDLIGLFDRESVSSSNDKLVAQEKICDFVIINGEGSFHHGGGVSSKLLYFNTKKPKVLINTVWEKMYFVDDILNKFAYISVRESKSYDEMRKSVPGRKICIVPDLSFYSTGKLLVNNIGFSDSVMDATRKDLVARKNYFPLQVQATRPDLCAYVNWMKSLDLYVTGRFHGICLAMMLKVPFLAIPSNSHKIEGLLEDCGCPDLIIYDEREIQHKMGKAKELIPKAYQYAESARVTIRSSFVNMLSAVNSVHQ